MTREDCIYFDVEKKESTGWNQCKKFYKIDNEGFLCNTCKLWDSYIPKTASPSAIEGAKRWQDMQAIRSIDNQIMRIIPKKY